MVELTSASAPARLPGRLRQAVQGRDEADVVTLQFTGLDTIQRVAGPLWLQRWSRIRRVADAFIRERLEPGDIFMRGTEAFIIAFGDRTGMAAREAAQDLTRELNQRLTEEEAPHAQVAASIQVIRVPGLAVSAAQKTLVQKSLARLAPENKAIVIPSVGEIDWRFHPVWDARHEVVSSFFVSPHHAGNGMRVRGYQYEDLDTALPDFIDLDAESVRVSERALQGLHEQRKRALVGMSLHVSTMASETGMDRILTALDLCDPMLASYRLIKITGISPGFPRMELRSIISALRARAPKVVLTAAWHEPDVETLIECGPTAFGFAYPDHVAGAMSNNASGTLLARCTVGIELAHADGVPLYVEGAIGPRLAREFKEAGADYICSPVIWSPLDAPEAALRWPSSRLVA